MNPIQAAIPRRRPSLSSCRIADSNSYLVRNRQTGDSFQLGPEEHFLLQRLDGTSPMGEVVQAFDAAFDEPLTEGDFDQFCELMTERGLLEDRDVCPDIPALPLGPMEQSTDAAAHTTARPVAWKLAAIRTISALTRLAGWLTWAPNRLAAWLQKQVRYLEYTPRTDDVFIVTYPRSGTTWMQMILYQLTTDGEMNLPHIAEFCPWFEKSTRSGRGFELRPSPRLFKSHLSYDAIPKGSGRYIYVARNGQDVAVSYYHLYCRYNGYKGTFDEFFELYLDGKVAFGSWQEHVASWWRHRHDPQVLFLTYEELTNEFDATIEKIAAFCGWTLTAEKLARVRERSSFDFMKHYEQKFDPALETLWEQGVQLKSFLRGGRIGDGTVTLSTAQKERFEQRFSTRMAQLEITQL